MHRSKPDAPDASRSGAGETAEEGSPFASTSSPSAPGTAVPIDAQHPAAAKPDHVEDDGAAPPASTSTEGTSASLDADALDVDHRATCLELRQAIIALLVAAGVMFVTTLQLVVGCVAALVFAGAARLAFIRANGTRTGILNVAPFCVALCNTQPKEQLTNIKLGFILGIGLAALN